MHKEFAIGAVSLTGQVITPNAYASDEYIQQETLHIREQLRAMYKKFMGNKQPTPLKGKVVIIIDDGVATGHTLLSTVEMIKHEDPKKIVIAVPVASKQAAQKLSVEVDEFVCVWIPSHFRAVGEFYADFEQISDEEVIEMLKPHPLTP
jgi:predicted phosphoribosyltransferase